MTQALYRKWRPQLWNEVIGQEHVIRTLQNAVRAERIGHAYLFAGPRGTGKTTTARLLAKAINCLAEDLNTRPCDQCTHCQAVNQGRFLDLIEIDAASNTSVEDVRSLRDKINFSPTQGRCKVYIIDEVHMLSTAAFNALLKTLEEPPTHAIFILATTEVHKIPATVLSRCQRHEFRRIPVNEIVSHLTALCKQEKLEIEPDALLLIARQATGSMRDAISLLDQLTSTGDKITLQTAQVVLGTAANQAVISLVSSILTKQTAEGLICIHQALDSGSDPRQFARQIVEYLRSLLLIQLNHSAHVEAAPEVRAQLAQQASQFEPASLLETIRLFNAAASEIRSAWQPGLSLELAFAQALIPSRAAAAAAPQPAPQVPQQASSSTALPSARPQEETSQKQAPPSRKESPLEEKTAPSARASSPAEPPLPPKPTAGGDLSLDEVRQHWKRIRAGVKQYSMSTEALLNSSRPLGVKNGVLVLGFATEVLKSKMEIRENLELVCQQITAATAKEIRLACIVNNKTNFDLDNLEVDSDGMVGAALNLGGQIVQKE